MHLSQSSLSRTVKQIETRLGARLLDRDTRNVGLTAEGRELLEIAEDTLARHRDGMTRMQTFWPAAAGRSASPRSPRSRRRSSPP